MFNETLIVWEDLEADQWQNYIFDTSFWVSNTLAPSSRYCFMIGMEGYAWGWTKAGLYDGFVDGFLAWLENLLGNVITFNSLYKKITEAEDADNQRELMYWYGRLCTLIINFDPIPEDQLEFQKLEDEDKFVPGVTELLAGIGAGLGKMNLPEKQRIFQSKINDIHHDVKDHMTSPRVQGWWDDTYGFSAGLIQASFGDASPNSSVCLTNVTLLIDKTVQMIDELRTATNETLNSSAETFESILGSLHPITFSCYHSVFEYGDVGIMYGEAIVDGLQLLYNIIHKLGKLYDCTFFLVKHHKDNPFKFVNEEGKKEKVVMPSLEDIPEDDIVAREEA